MDKKQNKKKFTLIFLHGWGQDKSSWNSFKQLFTEDYRLITWDLPGFGSELIPETTYGVPEYSEWVEKKITEEKLENIILMGFSLGGRITAYIAHKNPTWLKGIILAGTPTLYRPSKTILMKIAIYKLAKRIIPKKFLDRHLSQEDKDARDSGLGKIRYKVITFDQTQYLTQINFPTLILHGEKDSTVPIKIAKDTQTLIKNSILEIIPDASHFIFDDNPNLCYGKIQNFIKNL